MLSARRNFRNWAARGVSFQGIIDIVSARDEALGESNSRNGQGQCTTHSGTRNAPSVNTIPPFSGHSDPLGVYSIG